LLGFRGRESSVDGNLWLLVGKEDPVAIFLWKIAPRDVDVIPKGDKDISLVLAAPRGGPCRDGAFTDGKTGVRHHGLLGDLVDAT